MPHENLSAVPSNMSSVTDLPDLIPVRVYYRLQTAGVDPVGFPVEIRGGLAVQGGMRPLLIVFLTKPIEGLLLGAQVVVRRLRGLLLQGPVHPLMSSVLRRFAGRDPLRVNPQTNPPHAQLRKASDAGTGEGGAVIHSNPFRQSVLAEGGRKQSLYVRRVGMLQPLATQ